MSLPTLFASLPVPDAMRPTAIVVRALNAALRQEPWALQRLAQYVGRTVLLTVGNLHLPLSITYDGTLVLISYIDDADVQLTLPAHRLKEFPSVVAQSNHEALLALIHIQGDAGLANALAKIVSQLRFDPEAEIARFTGDLLAVRLMASLKKIIANGQRSALHIEANLAEFLGEESGMLVSSDYYHLWQDRLAQLEQRLQLLEKRTEQLRLKG